jgi:thiol reductant ABC exporter CydC subunit
VSLAPDDGGGEGAVAPLGRTMAIARPVTGRLVLVTVLGAGAIAADIGLIATAAWLIATAAHHPNESQLALAIVGVQCFGLSRGFFRYQERRVGHDTAFRLQAKLRGHVYQRLEGLAPSGLPAFRHGDLLARVVQDVDAMQDLVVRVVPPFGMALLVGLMTETLLWWILPASALVVGAALLSAATLVPWVTSALARRHEARFAGARGDLAAAMVDLTEGAAELTVFGATGAQLDIVSAADAELTEIASASAGTAGVGLALTTALAGLACVGCLVVGIGAVGSGRISGTDLAVITLIPLAAFELVVGLPVATQSLQRVRQAAARMFAVTDSTDPVREPDPPVPLPTTAPDLQLRSVWAGYPGATAPVLRDVDVSLPPGRRLAVIGPSGSGKSTLAAVLLRFLPTAAGSSSLGGVRLDCVSGDAFRTVVGLVGQDAYLFDGTVADNLRIGRREATDAELAAVLGRVGLAAWLAELPRGVDTDVGRRGRALSGGQRQRIAVARALLADFPVLVLDEPAEHLEPAAADALMADVLAATAGHTLVLITHRMAGLEAMDEVILLDRGRVVERGGHDDLLASGGRYSALWWDEMATDRYASDEPSARVRTTAPPLSATSVAAATTGAARHDQ